MNRSREKHVQGEPWHVESKFRRLGVFLDLRELEELLIQLCVVAPQRQEEGKDVEDRAAEIGPGGHESLGDHLADSIESPDEDCRLEDSIAIQRHMEAVRLLLVVTELLDLTETEQRLRHSRVKEQGHSHRHFRAFRENRLQESGIIEQGEA